MSLLAPACVAAVIAWVALVVAAQLLNPDQDPLSMGMSGLARGRASWVFKSAFIVRGLAALLLVPALAAVVGTTGLALVGLFLVWVWGVGSAALSMADTDMPGEPPTRAGAAHVLIALVAYVAGVAGAIVCSVALRADPSTAGVARWALPIALASAVALVVQFAGFGAAAREARSAAAGGPAETPTGTAAVTATAAGSAAIPAAAPAAASAAAPAAASASALVPPQLERGDRVAVRPVRHPGAAPGAALGLAGYAGLLQRVFVGLLMLWMLVVALGI